MTKPRVTIPKSELRTALDEAAAIQRDMASLLHELEERAAGRPIAKPGDWRHHPQTWPGRQNPT